MDATPFDAVIVGFDGSEQAADALALGRLFGSMAPSALVLAYVTDQQPPFESRTRTHGQIRRDRVERVLEPALSALAGRDGVEQTSIEASSAARGLYDLADEQSRAGTGVLVIGSTHRGPIGRVMIGSVGEQLVAGCPCPVLVAPKGFSEDSPESIAQIMVGFDGSPESRTALEFAARLARATSGNVRVVTVAHHSVLARLGKSTESDPGALQQQLDEVIAGLDVKASGAVVDGDPVERLAEAAQDADLLVLGARGYGPHQHVFLGSVSAKLMRHSPSPVLVLPRPAWSGSEGPTA